jgi:hypothetical protein
MVHLVTHDDRRALVLLSTTTKFGMNTRIEQCVALAIQAASLVTNGEPCLSATMASRTMLYRENTCTYIYCRQWYNDVDTHDYLHGPGATGSTPFPHLAKLRSVTISKPERKCL